MNRKYFDMPMKTLRTTPFGIFVDQAGYYSDSRKKAVIPFECENFEITDINGKVRFSGQPVLPDMMKLRVTIYGLPIFRDFRKPATSA